jgi:hypothetical protein
MDLFEALLQESPWRTEEKPQKKNSLAVEYVISRVQVNQGGVKLNGTHQLLVYDDDVNMLGGSVHTIKENAEGLVVV